MWLLSVVLKKCVAGRLDDRGGQLELVLPAGLAEILGKTLPGKRAS